MRMIRGATLVLAALTWPMVSEGQGGNRPPQRAQLEQRLRERLAAVVREQLQLDDEQMRRLSEVNQKYDSLRRTLNRREFQLRREMRQQLIEQQNPSEEVVSRLLSDHLRLQRERLDLLEAEQADLSRFLTAVQRAKYLGIQEQMRREMDRRRSTLPFVDDRGMRGGEPGRRGGRRPPGG